MDYRTLTWRALTTDDVPALTRAFAAVESADHTDEHYSEQDVRDELEDESFDLGRDSFAALTADGEIVAFVWIRGAAEVRDLDQLEATGAVVPAARRRGLGRRLLDWAEQRAASLHAERHPSVAAAICVDVHENNPGKRALVETAGYEATRWWYRMTHGLADPLPTVPPPPPGLVVTPYTRDRDEAVRQAHREAFAGHWGSTPPDEQRWRQRFTGASHFQPGVSWLVLDGDEVVAYLLTSLWEADASATGVREAFVAQLGVRPPWRRRGLGTLLLATALESYVPAGYDRSALTVDTDNATGALHLYERAGFALNDTAVSWTKRLA
ncbi:MAG TPA: GNAT family N-acetyltransferase [Solirubrobacteraceae bacterium]|nr:GNAT family N-acetyltransferase [Solirubrobacteraceae bacterium]